MTPPAAEGGAMAELEHLIGYQQEYTGTVFYHPTQSSTLIYTAGAAVIIEDVNDPHKQEFLRGHDADVCALHVSENGKLIASGQMGSPYRKGSIAPVLVWDFENRRRYMDFGGLSNSVTCIKFSPDGRFLCGCGANQMLVIWDVSTGEAIYSRRTESPCFLCVWGGVIQPEGASRYPSYMLATAYDNQVLLHSLDFDLRSMCYVLTSDKIAFPSSGLQRRHTCGIVSDDFLITGTAAGDILVFNLRTKVFRTALPLVNNGVAAVVMSKGTVYVAGGDGRVRALQGHDVHWDILAENVLDSAVSSMDCSADGAELIVGTRNGKIWRLLCSDLTATVQSASHTGDVTDVCFCPMASEAVATCSLAGEMCLWDLSDYSVIASAKCKSPALCICYSSELQEIIVGYEDGFVRGWDGARGSQAKTVWEIPSAHRGSVTAIAECSLYVVSGGSDCAVRLWHRNTRELMTQFASHKRAVCQVIVDNVNPHVLHSGSDDKMLVTYDLKQNRPIIQHVTQNSNITDLSQRKDRDHEVLASNLDGRILFWDVDYADPVGCLQVPGGEVCPRFLCLDTSPTGRYIACGAEDTVIYVFDLSSCQLIQMLEGHSKAVVRLSWSPDQKQIVSAGKDGCVCVWNFFEP